MRKETLIAILLEFGLCVILDIVALTLLVTRHVKISRASTSGSFQMQFSLRMKLVLVGLWSAVTLAEGVLCNVGKGEENFWINDIHEHIEFL
jgi:hypothetical protein